MTAITIELLVNLELLEHAPQFGDRVVMQVDARVDVQVIGSEATKIAADRSVRWPSVPT